jgi:hypothetical protein
MEHLLNSFENRLHCASFISKVVRKCKWYTNSSGTKPILQCCCTRSMVDFSHFYPMCMAVLHWDHLKFPSKLYHLDNLPILCEVQKLLCRLWNTKYKLLCMYLYRHTQIEIVYNFSSLLFSPYRGLCYSTFEIIINMPYLYRYRFVQPQYIIPIICNFVHLLSCGSSN